MRIQYFVFCNNYVLLCTVNAQTQFKQLIEPLIFAQYVIKIHPEIVEIYQGGLNNQNWNL